VTGASRGGGGRGGGLTELREALIRDLGLTPAQQTQLDAVLAEARQALAGPRAQDQDEAARARQRQQVREEIRTKVRAFLTPEQQRRYEAQAAGGGGASGGNSTARPPAPVMSARVFILGPDGKPKAVPISVGISDGSSSEVVQGELQPGQEVLVGQTGSGTRSGGQSGPRLRL
jgi:HlyD family secretion protein